jgi:hypothetical protein
MNRRPLLFITPAACAALVLTPAAAHADVSIPAPPGQASAVAAQVGSLLDISRTDATAGSGAPTASASVIRLQGQPVLNLGGSQTGDGETGGSLLDTGSSLPARAQVAPWHAAADGSHGPTRHAKGSAAAARAELPGVARAGVLTSSSEASHTDQASHGSAISDGVDVSLLEALRLDLLHSEVNSDGQGHSYLVGLNGTEIGTDDQLGATPLCSLTAAGLLNLSCLTASGGLTGGGADVATVTPVLDALATVNPIAAFTAATTSGSGSAAPIAAAAPDTAVSGSEASRAVTSPAAPTVATDSQTTGSLPRTGSSPAPLLATALSALFAGLGLRRFRTRPARG